MNYGNDIGYLGNNPGSISISNNAPVKHTQVYYATHRDNGARSSFMGRSFISFSFGGKWIEDFNLIACINGDRLNKQLHANFNDLTSEYEVVNGQFYWGTYYTNNQISFTLATDGITQNQLDEFKNWFAPGQVRELVLSEHPNRAIMARVMEPPVMDIIPFEEETTVMVNTKEYKTSTTIYKGEFTLNLVMDEPFWHSKSNLLVMVDSLDNLKNLIRKNGVINNEGVDRDGKYYTIEYTNNIDNSTRIAKVAYDQGQIWADLWSDANDNIVPILEDKDALKVILEDGVPTIGMIRDPMFLGNGIIFDYIESNARVGYAIVGIDEFGHGARVGEDSRIIEKLGSTINIPQYNNAYLYYAGTAPELPRIKFKIKPNNLSIDNRMIELSKNETQRLVLKPPLIIRDYYTTIQLVNEVVNDKIDSDTARKKGNQLLTHIKIRELFFKILNYIDMKITGYNDRAIIREQAVKPFLGIVDDSDEKWDIDLNFQTGEMIGTFKYGTFKEKGKYNELNSFNDFSTSFDLVTYREDVSDMILSKPLILNERTYPTGKGVIITSDDITSSNCYIVSHNFNDSIDLSITFQNKYY